MTTKKILTDLISHVALSSACKDTVYCIGPGSKELDTYSW